MFSRLVNKRVFKCILYILYCLDTPLNIGNFVYVYVVFTFSCFNVNLYFICILFTCLNIL